MESRTQWQELMRPKETICSTGTGGLLLLVTFPFSSSPKDVLISQGFGTNLALLGDLVVTQ